MTVFTMIPVHPDTKARFREIKTRQGHTYDFMVRQFLDRIDAQDNPANRLDLRREK